MEADSSLEATIKDSLRPKYQQAIESLKTAAGHLTSTAAYRTALETAALDTASLQAMKSKLPAAEAVTAQLKDSEISQKELETRQAALAGLKEKLEFTTNELTRL